jgi:hypothetical protein
MAAFRWNATVVDSPGFEPWVVIGDLVVAVRTPRSHNFVTVEVAPTSFCGDELAQPTGVRRAPVPPPRLRQPWHGELQPGDTVGLFMGGASYRLTLDRLAESPAGLPWVVCDFCLERD